MIASIIFYQNPQDTIVRDQCEELVRTADFVRAEMVGHEITDGFVATVSDIKTGPGWLALVFPSGRELTVNPESQEYTILWDVDPQAGS